ncbi:tyrosine-type recombinase/integrase [Ralstonia pseudosolanacearum]|uniref:tyrosine-type recombinase/integrase n=1 Tax=Ralstonia pseudosolanacearum TaxID=1310165 RepID=UPI003CEF96C3
MLPEVQAIAFKVLQTRPVPLEKLYLPEELSGNEGTNRAPHKGSQLAANDDLSALFAWLALYVDTPPTFAKYRREVERLLLWSVLQLGKPLSSLTHEDLLAYKRFLADPHPADRWVLAGKKKLARSHPDWRPFAGKLDAASVHQAMVVLNACFAWLTEARYLAGNPLSLARRRRKASKPRIERYLSYAHWAEVKQTVETMPVETERDRLHAARCRWLFTVFYLGGLRASEVTGTTMGAFFSRRDANGAQLWWLEVTGKGDKTRLVPVTDEWLAELKRYRLAQGLPAVPLAGETFPLVRPVIGREKGLTRGALHLILKEIFSRTANRLQTGGPKGVALAADIKKASAHWLRHTAGSHMADRQVDLRYVRDTFGHDSIATSNNYIHTEDDARHQAIQERHRIGWS